METQDKFELGPLQQKWIIALKSEEYKQGGGLLYRASNDSYCCLGVANKSCDLKETNPYALMCTWDKLGLRDASGSFKYSVNFNDGNKFETLIGMNDAVFKKSFKEIADFIERNPELIFTKSI